MSIKIVVGMQDNTVDHKALNAELKALGVPGFHGTSSLIRERVGDGMLAVPRYVLVKTEEELAPQMEANIRTLVLAHVHRGE